MVTHKASRGFSLIELLVVVGIFTVITTLILANHSRFNSSVLLGSLAYDIALSIREAQVYGVSVRGVSTNFQVGYGVHFSGANSFVLFADSYPAGVPNKKYDAQDTIVSTYTLNPGHSIANFCGVDNAGAQSCSATGAIASLDIVFLRPEPDANISSPGSSPYAQGIITVKSSAGQTRAITVASTGQIAVSNPNP
jgi:prepilin-type N-terminal cleavage/methylation domain-containing protein